MLFGMLNFGSEKFQIALKNRPEANTIIVKAGQSTKQKKHV